MATLLDSTVPSNKVEKEEKEAVAKDLEKEAVAKEVASRAVSTRAAEFYESFR